ncbi:MAG: exodeoxyribonuclease VII small subunit [Chloroflexi bacterium]|nr:exodeoxyribonuclease VII small subunit [Chloroflexota bacterium]
MNEHPSKPSRRERLSFEEAFARLEQTVKALEQGGLTLEEATRLYAEGVRLARLCNEHLSKTELKVSHLQTSYGEQMRFLGEAAEDSASDEDEKEP